MAGRNLCSQCRHRADTFDVARVFRGRDYSARVCVDCVTRLLDAQATGRHYGNGWDTATLHAALSAADEMVAA